MKLSELKETLEQRENYFQNLQNLEKILENDEALAKKIEAKGEFTMPVHDVVTYARMAYYDGKITPIKKAIKTAERELDIDVDETGYSGREVLSHLHTEVGLEDKERTAQVTGRVI